LVGSSKHQPTCTTSSPRWTSSNGSTNRDARPTIQGYDDDERRFASLSDVQRIEAKLDRIIELLRSGEA
jgi:hypothetical protein